MKRIFFFALQALFIIQLSGQVSISVDNSPPDPSAMLDIKSVDKGVLLPRVSLVSINSPAPVQNPSVGLMIYNTATAGDSIYGVTPGYYFWDGDQWHQVSVRKGDNIGDMHYWNGKQWVSIPVGKPGQYLQLSVEGIPAWSGVSYPTISTLPVTSVTDVTAVCGGNIISDGGAAISERGVCWNTTGAPVITENRTIDGNGTGTYNSLMTGLTQGTQYYVRAYCTNSVGTIYGNELVFKTLTIPSVTTDTLTEITQTTAKGGGTVVADGGSPVTVRGLCWSLNPNPTVDNFKTADGTGTGSFTSNLTNLTVQTTYYVRAYAVNAIGTAYGDQVIFTTLPPPVPPIVTTSPVINITSNSAYSGGNVTFGGYSPVTARGICWSLSPNPSLSDHFTSNGSGTGSFTSMMSELLPDTVYYVSAYATNVAGTSYGAQVSFRTLLPYCPGIPTVLYEGKTYNTVLIGSQCWFRENLNIGTKIAGNVDQTDNNIIEKYCLNDLETNCNVYGGLYQWNELMDYVSLNGTKGLCPQGWHVSTFNELTDMIYYLGGATVAGGAMKEKGTAHWLTPNTGATNASVFTALPGSFRTINGNFGGSGTEMDMWTSTRNTSGYLGLLLSHNSAATTLVAYASNTLGFSARCLKDTCVNYSTVSVSVSASGNGICAGTSVTFTATPVNGGEEPFYQWYVNGVKMGTNSPVYIYIPANNDVITCHLYSSNPCASNPATSTAVTMTVHPVLPASVSISASSSNVCAGTSVTYTATPVNGGANPAFQWKKGSTNISGATNISYSYIPANGDQISCVMTSSIPCPTGSPATSNTISMTVNPVLPVSLTISTPATTVCAGTSATFTANPVNGGATPLYQWKKGGANISGATNATYTYTPVNNDLISCVLTSSLACKSGSPATSSTITMTVNPLLPVSVTVSAPATTICAGTSLTFTATPVNGGTSPAYQWQKGTVNISGATSSTYTYIPANGDQIRCVVTSNAACATGSPATSNTLTLTVNPVLPVSVTITAAATTVCSGTSVTFNASPVNGGSQPAYQWRKGTTNISGATSSTYSYIPENGDAITCVLTSNATCTSGNPATSNAITMTVNPVLPVSVSIAASANPSCSGTSVTYTATPVNGGSSPAYQWKLNGSNITGATNITYSKVPANNDVYSCVMTSSATCTSGNPATSNSVTMTVNPVVTVSVSITSSATTVCAGTSVTYTATPVNGGTSPAYQWKLNGSSISGATNATYSHIPVSGNSITCMLTSSATCTSGNPATSNAISVTVNPLLPVSVTVSATAYAVMPGTAVTYTATVVNGGTNPVYQWKKNGSTIGSSNPSYTLNNPSNNDNISCVVTSNASGCISNNPATSNVVNMIVYSTGTACSGIPTVTYGGRTYNTVQIGTQCWLRESMNIGNMISASTSQTNNGVIEKFCYNNDSLNCNVYGGLYQWAEMVQYLNGVTNTTHWSTLPTTPVQGICPSGWHLPDTGQLSTFIAAMGGVTVASGNMKETGTVHWGPMPIPSNIGATNSKGYTLLPAGGVLNGSFSNLRSYANVWTITKGEQAVAARWWGASYASAYYLYGEASKTIGYQVRCLKD